MIEKEEDDNIKTDLPAGGGDDAVTLLECKNLKRKEKKRKQQGVSKLQKAAADITSGRWKCRYLPCQSGPRP